MPGVEDLWERLVRATLDGNGNGNGSGSAPSNSLGSKDIIIIDHILMAAHEIQHHHPNVSTILCEHAYSLAQNLDPNCEGRGVLQFKTGVTTLIEQKLANKEGGGINGSNEIARLLEFYKLYREKNDIDQLEEEEMKSRESGELQRKRERILGTLGIVLEQLTKGVSPEEEEAAAAAEKLISTEV